MFLSEPFDAIDLDDLAAGQRRGRLGTRLVLGVLDVDDLVAGLPFVTLEHERSRAGVVGDLLVVRRRRDARRHDERHGRTGLAQRFEYQTVGLFQLQHEGPGVNGARVFHDPIERPAQRVLLRPALQRGDDVGARDRRAVVPFQPVAQSEGPGQLVVAQRPLVDHLRLDLAGGIGREQRIVDHVAVIARDVGGGPDRVEDLEIRMRHDPQRRLRLGRAGDAQRQRRGDGRSPESANKRHGPSPVV
jgi:hypothetical protein